MSTYWCQTRFVYQLMFVFYNSNNRDAPSGGGSAYT